MFHFALIADARQVKTRVMHLSPNPGLHAQIAAAFDWWRDAGVDSEYTDDPRDWLAKIAAPEAPEVQPAFAKAEPARIQEGSALAELVLPDTLAAFGPWWLAEPGLGSGTTTGRVPPRGKAHARVMVIVDQPERGDSDRLLSGPQGRLLDAMLAAMGIAEDDAYIASVLPRHTPHADWEAVTAAGFGKIVARHVSLAAPARLIVFGSNILPLFGNDLPLSPAVLRQFNQEGANVPLLAEVELAALLERPRWKARFWQRWLDWVAGGTGTGPDTQ